MNTEEIKKELKQKERKTQDLLRYIKTRNDNNPNYSILLGSGCSVTSGIRSGSELIRNWKKEVYQNLNPDDHDYDEEKATQYLVKNCGAWYNKSSEYSSLFEKKYDLPRQRRMFVEKEVSDKTPSIGYAYLVNLIRDSYFNTLFTTNFDDLINEAFYQFSEQRPMICAHDSSINSITVTSKRPKIIKLHGDYLFDDIKSTLRETESLEDNIRNKFIEFSKDYGLIVVGYAGNDRSIMDVINYLLKHEDYYKGGVYWCIRKGDEIGEELRKLLWKDRVYFVEIDGFDELFAELHSNIYKGKLPIDTNFVSNKSQEIIEKFVSNTHLQKTSSEVIKNDLENLKAQSERNNIYETLKQMQSNDEFASEKYDNKEIKTLIELTILRKEERFEEMLKIIDESINKTTNKYFKTELYRRRLNAYDKLGNSFEENNTINKLIDIDGEKPEYLMYKSAIKEDISEKINWIDKALSLDGYNEVYYNKKIKLLIEKYDFGLKPEDNYQEIMALIERSIKIDPSISNRVYEHKFDFLLKNKKIDQSKEVIEVMRNQNPFSINILNMQFDLLKTDSERENFIDEVKKAKDKYFSEDKLAYEMLILNTYYDLNDKEKIKEILDILGEKDIYKNNTSFLRRKANLYLDKFDRLKEAIKILYEALNIESSRSTIKILIDYLLYDDKTEEAKSIFNKYKYYFSKEDMLFIERDIYDKEKNYGKCYEIMQKLKSLKPHLIQNYITTESYYLIQLKDYKGAKTLLRKFLDERSFNITLEEQIINYELSCKLLNEKPSKKRLEEIKSGTKSHSKKAAIYSILGNKVQALKELKEMIDNDMSTKYVNLRWPVFDSIRSDSEFKKLNGPTNSMNNNVSELKIDDSEKLLDTSFVN